ncbi:MAG: hypothetical protein EZS28_037114, partial [Streblomastix strix]
CCTTTLRRKVNLHPDTDERRRIWGLIIRPGLQRSHFTRNSTIACVETDTRTRKLRPNQSTSRPLLRSHDVTRTADSTAGDVYTNLNRISILFRITDTKTLDIIAIPGIWHVPGNTTILRFSVTKHLVTGPTYSRLQYLIIQTAKHYGSAKLSRPSNLLIKLPKLET